VTEFAIEIANNIEEEVDPVVVICGALLHDIGRTISDEMHGLVGGSIAEELLESLPLSDEQAKRITKVIVRHTATSHVVPQSVEEKIVYDADGLDRLGTMGLLRGFVGKKGSMVEVLESCVVLWARREAWWRCWKGTWPRGSRPTTNFFSQSAKR
jgi:HD superfamily phosphodiesterase